MGTRFGFNVTIGADTNPFSQALKKLNAPIKEAQNELSKMSKALKLDPTNTTLIKNAHSELATQILESQNKVKGLKGVLQQLNDEESKNGGLTTEQIRLRRSVESEIEIENKSIKILTKQYNQWGSVAVQQIAGVGVAMQQVGSKIEAVGQKLKGLSLVASGALLGIVKTSMDFEDAWTGVTKTVDGTESELNSVRQSIIDLSKETGISKNEIAGVAQVAGQLGIKVNDISEFTKVMTNLGVATDLTAEQSAEAIAKIANITGMAQKDFGRFGASLTALGNNFATQESNILEMATRLASTGDLVGLTEPQILALSTALNSLGAEAEAGGTAMSKMFRKMQLSVETGDKNLKKFAKVSGMTVSEFTKAFETDALGALNSFVKGLGTSGDSAIAILDDMNLSEVRLSDSLLKLVTSEGMLDSALEVANTGWQENTALTNEASKRYDETKYKLGQLKETLGEIAVDLGEVLLPVIKKVVDKIKDFTDKFTNMSDGQKKAIVTILGIVAVLSPLLITIGKLTIGVGQLMTYIPMISSALSGLGSTLVGLISNPVGITILAVGAVIAILVTLYNKCEWFRNGVNAIVSAIVNKVKEIWNWLKVFFTETIPQWIDNVKMVLENLPYYIGYLIGLLVAKFVNFVSRIWNFITNDLPQMINKMVGWFETLPERIALALLKALLKLAEWIVNMKKKADEELPKLIDNIINWFKELPEKLKEIGKNAIEGLVNGIKEKWEALKGTVGNFVNGIKEGFQKGLDIHSPSRVMRDLVGKNIVLGIEEGFTQNLPTSLNNMQSALVGSMKDFQFGATGGNTLNIYTQELDSDKLEQIIDYVNLRFGYAY